GIRDFHVTGVQTCALPICSLVLVTSAGLLVRSLSHQLNAKLGFDAVHGLTFEVSLPPMRYPEHPFATGMEHAAAVQFLSAALDRSEERRVGKEGRAGAWRG